MDREDLEIDRAIRKGCLSILRDHRAREAQRVWVAKMLARANGLSFSELMEAAKPTAASPYVDYYLGR